MAASALALASCAPADVTVSGNVTLNGQPVSKGVIDFSEVESTKEVPPASAPIVNGQYTLKVRRGKKAVRISSPVVTGTRPEYVGPGAPQVEITEESIPNKYNASTELRTENEAVAQYVDMASDQLRRMADQIRQKGVSEMVDDLNRFARRRPALFIGGALLVGIGIARFLKASADRGEEREYGNGFSSVDPMTASTGSPSYSGDLGETGY